MFILQAMKRFCFALTFFALLSFNALSQTRRTNKHVHRPNKIDSAAIFGASDDSVSVWEIIDTVLARRSPSYRPGGMQERFKLLDKVAADQRRIMDSLGVQVITKADFDDNGLTDMICWLGGTFVVLDEGGGQYRLVPLDESFGDEAFPVLHYNNQKAEILYYNYPGHDFYINYAAFQGTPLKLRMDTLVYYKGAFVEKNTHPRPYRIEHIHIITSGCMERSCSYDLSIDSTGKAVFVVDGTYEDSSGKGLSGTYKATISQSTLQDIYCTLCYIDFPRHGGYYRATAPPGSDLGGTTTITYDGGQTLKIEDDGVSTHGWTLVYHQLSELKRNQKWIKADVSSGK